MLRLLLLLVGADAALLRPTADSVAFRAGQHGYRTYRIPGFVRARNGALLALAEGRVRIDGPQVPCHGWSNNTCCYGKPASDFDGLCYDKCVPAPHAPPTPLPVLRASGLPPSGTSCSRRAAPGVAPGARCRC